MPDYEEMAYRAVERKMVQYEREIAEVLRNALDEIRKEMSKIYEKYASGGILTKAEMTKYNRLTTLEKQIDDIMKPAIKETGAILDRIPPAMYNESFFHYAWAMDQTSGLRIAWGVLNEKAIVENLANTFAKIALQRYKLNSPLQFRAALSKGLIQGQSYVEMMRDLKKAVNLKNYEAMRILRTEGQYAVNAGQADLYNRAIAKGIEGNRIYDATLDARTRQTHGAADGQPFHPADGTFQVDGIDSGYFIVGGEKTPYPAWEGLSAENRVNCRCRVRFQIDGYSPQLRRTRGEGIIPYQTYSDYVEQYHPEWRKK